MKKILSILLAAVLMLAAAGCGTKPPAETTEANGTESSDATSNPDVSIDESTSEDLRVILLDNDKDGVNDFKIVVDIEAAKSTEKVPFRIPDLNAPSEDSFRTVSLYNLKDGGEKLVWYTNLCMGSEPRGGVALKNGGVFSYYYDIYEYGEGRKVSISCYEYVGDIYGNQTYQPKLKTGSFVTNEISDDIWADDFGERKSYSLRNAVDVLDDMLSDAEILLDVTGTEPIFSTDENRFTKSYANTFDYRDLEASLAEEIQDSFIIPAK